MYFFVNGGKLKTSVEKSAAKLSQMGGRIIHWFQNGDNRWRALIMFVCCDFFSVACAGGNDTGPKCYLYNPPCESIKYAAVIAKINIIMIKVRE